VPEFVHPGAGDVQEASYANTFPRPLTDEAFFLSGAQSDAAKTYELRRGDHKGRLLLALPEKIVCQQDDRTLSSNVRRGGDRLNRDLSFVSLELYPGYLEVAAAGSNLPKRLWARLGSQEVALPIRTMPEVDQARGGESQQAYYANTFAPSLKEAAFSLDDRRSDTTDTYDLHRGDRNGRRLLALPDTIVCQHGDRIVCSTPQIKAGRLIGRVFDPANPGGVLSIELLESSPSDSAEASREMRSLGKSIVKGSLPDRNDSQAASEPGFSLALPPALFDGATHNLRLDASHQERVQVLWRDTFQASSKWVEAQIRSCKDRAELRRLLITLAEARRFDEIAGYFNQVHRAQRE
jgi:hypothetical protein